MELFDLVDEKDNVIGTTDKVTAHSNGGIHRIVAIFVFDTKGRLLVQEHLASGGLFDNSVGGHVDKGESYDQAAKREMWEEINLDTPLTKVSVFYSDETWDGNEIKHFISLYECNAPKDWKFKQNEEVKHLYPTRLEKIVNDMNTNPKKFTGGFRNTMYEYIKKKNLPFKLKNYNLGRTD